MLKAFDADGEGMRKHCAYHRTADGRRFFLIPDIEANRQLVRERGPGWALKADVDAAQAQAPVLTEQEKKDMVTAELTRLGIPHRANMKLESLIHKLPVGARAAFL
jgi:hypothetical protein